MKVTVVNGSARIKGNSHAIVNALCEGFAEDAEIKSYELSKMTNSGCLGCMSCKGKTERCIIQDDLTPVYEEIHESDVLVLASPVYFGDVSGQAKIFIDRLYHLFAPDFHDGFDPEGGVIEEKMRSYSRLKRGVKFVFVTSQGAAMEDMYADIQGRYPLFFKYLGFDEVYSIRGLGDPIAFPEANRMEDALEQARELGKRLSF
ncbi:flavodoxin family protein [Maridesulfovibrio salexigens]|uniref:NADPH-dependent FMN reductase n=1 Tax=Maridesulfovibrio salexigens (strain ATCC 14822 / DSM 2638 / NCIMB 8403 / VKM B-1763) TaxID=526222 RepID=C6BRM2_MARSD|nr:flavodoxin family protein [Maridesulfovibrio salexigens]ACS79462.1 NADPH-dependent FMN reductase [Maridesulfovibrio salexigens DSM 2638]